MHEIIALQWYNIQKEPSHSSLDCIPKLLSQCHFSDMLANINYKWSAFLYWVVQINENEHHLLTNKTPNQLRLPVSLHIGNEFIHSIQKLCMSVDSMCFLFHSSASSCKFNETGCEKSICDTVLWSQKKPCWNCAEIDRQQQKKIVAIKKHTYFCLFIGKKRSKCERFFCWNGIQAKIVRFF